MMGVRPDELVDPRSREALREWTRDVYVTGPALTLGYAALTAASGWAAHAEAGTVGRFVIVVWMAAGIVAVFKGTLGYLAWIVVLPLMEGFYRVNGLARGVAQAGRRHPDELLPPVYFDAAVMPRLGRVWARHYVGALRWVRGLGPPIAVMWSATMLALAVWALVDDGRQPERVLASTLVEMAVMWTLAGLVSVRPPRKVLGGLLVGWYLLWAATVAGQQLHPPRPVELAAAVGVVPPQAALMGPTMMLAVMGLVAMAGVAAQCRAWRHTAGEGNEVGCDRARRCRAGPRRRD